jgi:CRISPR-associated protein Cmr1
MKTRVPQHNAPAVKKRQDNLIRQVRRYKLITPLFGGGVEPHQADPVTIVRGTEVRGHLRFWWRATRGGQFNGSLKEMRRREEEIWGSAAAKDKPGPSMGFWIIHSKL